MFNVCAQTLNVLTMVWKWIAVKLFASNTHKNIATAVSVPSEKKAKPRYNLLQRHKKKHGNGPLWGCLWNGCFKRGGKKLDWKTT